MYSYILFLQPERKKPKSIYVCPHCQKNLSWKTYCDHRRLYFNSSTKHWLTQGELDVNLNSDQTEETYTEQLVGHGVCDSPPASPSHSLMFTHIESLESNIDMDPPTEGKWNNFLMHMLVVVVVVGL